MTLNFGSININMVLGVLAICGIGVLFKLDLLDSQFASLAIGTLLGAGASKVPSIVGGGKAEPPAEPVPPAQ